MHINAIFKLKLQIMFSKQEDKMEAGYDETEISKKRFRHQQNTESKSNLIEPSQNSAYDMNDLYNMNNQYSQESTQEKLTQINFNLSQEDNSNNDFLLPFAKPKRQKNDDLQDITTHEKRLELTKPLVNPYDNFTCKVNNNNLIYQKYYGNNRTLLGQQTMIWQTPFDIPSRYVLDFEEIVVIGNGSFSSVTCCKHRLNTQYYAIKKINEKLENNTQIEFAHKEIFILNLLTRIDCPHIMKYYTHWIENSQMYIQCELCHLGSLEGLINGNILSNNVYCEKRKDFIHCNSLNTTENENIYLSQCANMSSSVNIQHEICIGIKEDLAWLILKIVCETLDFIHQIGFVHLDLRPANIFIKQIEPLNLTNHVDCSDLKYIRDIFENALLQGKYTLRIGDFGHSKHIQDNNIIMEGDSRYCPRELINCDNNTIDLMKCDMFSLGMTIYELCLGHCLTCNGDEDMTEWHHIRDGYLNNSFSKSYSSDLVSIIKQLLNEEPLHRPSAAEILKKSKSVVKN